MYPDCCYFALLNIKNILQSGKEAAKATRGKVSENLTQNSLDLLRVIVFPTIALDPIVARGTFLVNSDAVNGDGDLSEDDDNNNADSESDSDGDKGDLMSVAVKRKRERALRAKGGTVVATEKSSKKRKRLSRVEQLVDVGSYRQVFSRAWVTLLGVGSLSVAQHKAILKHLSDHVMPHLHRPLLLADYLSASFAVGGVVSVLALESLFALIVMHNLDYPKFFVALYQLCNLTVFSAKYRSKFMKLLSRALTSTNIPSYMVAAFCKRLSGLALSAPSPAALFCLAQVTQLLKDHPQCVALLHRAPPSAPASTTIAFDDLEDQDLENANAMESSLWEMAALKSHHFYGVSGLAESLENAASTETGAKASIIVMDDFATQNYASLIDAELTRAKKNSALEFRKPISFFADSTVMECFGGNM